MCKHRWRRGFYGWWPDLWLADRESSEHTLRLATAVAALAVSKAMWVLPIVRSWPQ